MGDYLKLLAEQISLVYPEVDMTSNRHEIKIRNHPFKGINITILKNFIFSLKMFEEVDINALKTYLKPRFSYDQTRFYYNKNSFSVYLDKTFTNGPKGSFEKAMWQFEVLQFVIDNIEKMMKEINA